jgi:prepilin-type N-terminal cleavage/methylation domain-containing protein
MKALSLRHRRGFTLIELLVVLGIISLLMMLTLPAIQRVREAANRTNCANHQRQLALAMHTFHHDYKHFPVNGSVPFYTQILPYVEQEPLANQLKAGGAPIPLKVFTCPSRRSPTTALCDYAGFLPTVSYTYKNVQYIYDPQKKYYQYTYDLEMKLSKTVLGDDSKVRIEDIRDGTSNVALFTDKWVSMNHLGGSSPADLPWNQAGPIAYILTKYRVRQVTNTYPSGWTYVTMQWIPDGQRAALSVNTKRQPYFLPDRYGRYGNWYYTYSGSSHLGGAQPVAFADHAVRNLRRLPANAAGIDDGGQSPKQ